MKNLIFALLFSTFSIVYSMKDDYIVETADRKKETIYTSDPSLQQSHVVLNGIEPNIFQPHIEHSIEGFGKSCNEESYLKNYNIFTCFYDPSVLQKGSLCYWILLNHLKPHIEHNTEGFGKSCNEESYLKILDNLEKLQVTNFDKYLDEVSNDVDSADSLYQKNANAHTFKETTKDGKPIYATASDEFIISSILIYKITEEAEKQKKEGQIKSTTIDKGRDLLLKLQSFNEKIENDNRKKDLETVMKNTSSIKTEDNNCKKDLEKAEDIMLKSIRSIVPTIILISKVRSLYIEGLVNNYSIKMDGIIKKEGN